MAPSLDISTAIRKGARISGGLLVALAGLAAVSNARAADEASAGAQQSWYSEIIQVADGAAPLDTGDGRPSEDGRWYEQEREGHAAPVLHDWNGDGLKDLVIGGFSGRVRIYSNRGAPGAPAFDGYEWAQTGDGDVLLRNFCCTATGPRFADIDGDGREDLTVGSYSPGLIYWFPGEIEGLGPRQVLTDGGGLPVIVRLDEVASQPHQNYAAKAAWLDWNDDGMPDLVVGNAQGDLVVRRNRGASPQEGVTAIARQPVFDVHSWSPDYSQIDVFDAIAGGGGHLADEEYLSPATADWNADGRTDLLIGTQSGAVYLLLNERQEEEGPRFAAPSQLLPGVAGGEHMPTQILQGAERPGRGARVSVDAVDWNADGKLDLVVGDWTRSVRLRGDLTPAEKDGLSDVFARLFALDARAGLSGEIPLRDRFRTATAYYENEDLAAELGVLESELTAYLEPVGETGSRRLSDYTRSHGHVRVYIRR